MCQGLNGVTGVSQPFLHHVELFDIFSKFWESFGIDWPRFRLLVWGVQFFKRVFFWLLQYFEICFTLIFSRQCIWVPLRREPTTAVFQSLRDVKRLQLFDATARLFQEPDDDVMRIDGTPGCFTSVIQDALVHFRGREKYDRLGNRQLPQSHGSYVLTASVNCFHH